jgi:molybdate transport system substrate-binding protein
MKRIIGLLALAACLALSIGSGAQEGRTLVVFAAASLADVFEDIAADFEAAHPGVDVLFSFGGSSELAAQIAEGAPADVFASANPRQMGAAQESGRIDADAPRIFARNRLTLIVPADNPAGIESLADLAQPGLTLVVASEGVPVRDYTETMLALLAEDDAFGAVYVEAFRANIASEEPNVRQVAAKVALGEADAGIVYASDVTPDLRESVLSFEIPDAVNTIAEYPIAALNDTPQPELAAAFVDAVVSGEGQATLGTWGFLPAAPEPVCFTLLFVVPVCLR